MFNHLLTDVAPLDTACRHHAFVLLIVADKHAIHAVRVKLSTELQRRSTGRTIYVLDEPTTGLHFEDVSKLLIVLNRLVDAGNTVIVIEHNLDVIKCADWIIDMGPEGGFRGGTVIAQGTPEEVAKVSTSYTGKFVKEILSTNRKTSKAVKKI